MSTATTYRRALRRETHSPRTASAVVVAVVLLVGLVALVASLVAEAVRPGTVGALVEPLPADALRIGIPVAGGAMAVLGLAAVLLAILPGRRARRSLRGARLAVVADDGVLADAAADAVARRCVLPRAQVRVVVGRRVDVHVVPTSGVPVDERAAGQAAHDALLRLGLDRVVRVRVEQRGVIA
ncbi:DNA/RNA endonuclease G [Microbacterium resistens]|uniref:DNA/RNA endonuclease G n=1 Tax=Microbacterium resistens TaxID=156977 RepID=UPI001C5933EA|nr:DNA/RNA endonuclease G [Microbacterium resistens]MBW1639770.1 DNA/RNA endonuclease G [Microbacterium resistens]